jgi:hypothetical protein
VAGIVRSVDRFHPSRITQSRSPFG